MSDARAILKQAEDWQAAGRPVALATVVGTWGSSPRPAGSMLAVAADRSFMGSVSGGCVEGAVIEEAVKVLRGGPPRLLDYGISDDRAWEVGLACGGEMKVFVDRAPDAAELRTLGGDAPVARVVDLEDGSATLVGADTAAGPLALDPPTLATVRQAIRDGASRTLEGDGRRLFVHIFAPPLRLVLVGAVHIAQALAPMAALAGFAVTVVDPRRGFSTDARFPGVTLDQRWPDEALAALKPDRRTAVATLTHDPKLDDPALHVALASPAFYVGALGSRRTHAKRVARLREAGIGEAAIARIRSPIGLPLGGRTAPDIAVSILAEVLAAAHGNRLAAVEAPAEAVAGS